MRGSKMKYMGNGVDVCVAGRRMDARYDREEVHHYFAEVSSSWELKTSPKN